MVSEQKSHLDVLDGEIRHSPFCIQVAVNSCALPPSLTYTAYEAGMVIILALQDIKTMQRKQLSRRLRSWRVELMTLLTATYFCPLRTLLGNRKARRQ